MTTSDPALLTVSTAYPAPPLPPFSYPPIKMPSLGPRGHLNLYRRINHSAVCFAVLAGIEVHKTFSRLASDKKSCQLRRSRLIIREAECPLEAAYRQSSLLLLAPCVLALLRLKMRFRSREALKPKVILAIRCCPRS
jgi:hypothetical protein